MTELERLRDIKEKIDNCLSLGEDLNLEDYGLHKKHSELSEEELGEFNDKSNKYSVLISKIERLIKLTEVYYSVRSKFIKDFILDNKDLYFESKNQFDYKLHNSIETFDNSEIGFALLEHQKQLKSLDCYSEQNIKDKFNIKDSDIKEIIIQNNVKDF